MCLRGGMVCFRWFDGVTNGTNSDDLFRIWPLIRANSSEFVQFVTAAEQSRIISGQYKGLRSDGQRAGVPNHLIRLGTARSGVRMKTVGCVGAHRSLK